MNCLNCNEYKIGPTIQPYGGFLCDLGHLQCWKCDEKARRHCVVCGKGTIFIEMIVRSPIPTAPPMESDFSFQQTEIYSPVSEVSIPSDSFNSFEVNSSASCNETSVGSPESQTEQDLIVYPTTGTAMPKVDNFLTDKEKQVYETISMRMAEVLKTVKEETLLKVKQPNEGVKKGNQENVKNPHQTKTSELPKTSPKEQIMPFSTCCRAYYNPPKEPAVQLEKLTKKMDPPPQQFQKIRFAFYAPPQKILQKKPPRTPLQLSMQHHPTGCPDSMCDRNFLFITDLSRHIINEHRNIPAKRISPQQFKSFFLDVCIPYPTPKCQMMFLLRGKVCNLGNGLYQNYLPIFIMTTQINLAELCDREKTVDNDLLMIWVTGLLPKVEPIKINITMWRHTGPTAPVYHNVYSGKVLSVRNKWCPKKIFKTGQMILLTRAEIDLLRGNDNAIEMQLMVH